MTKISGNSENINTKSVSNPMSQNADRGNSSLFLYNGSYHMVLVDSQNNKEYIFDKSGKKLYLDDIVIFQMQNDMTAQQNKLLSSFDEQKNFYQKWQNHWLEKLQIANKQYTLFSHAKKTANTGYENTLSQAGCSSMEELKEYDKANGGGLFDKAKNYLTQRTDARSGQIRSESDAAFYGRMYVDESNNVKNIEYQAIMANSIFSA